MTEKMHVHNTSLRIRNTQVINTSTFLRNRIRIFCEDEEGGLSFWQPLYIGISYSYRVLFKYIEFKRRTYSIFDRNTLLKFAFLTPIRFFRTVKLSNAFSVLIYCTFTNLLIQYMNILLQHTIQKIKFVEYLNF